MMILNKKLPKHSLKKSLFFIQQLLLFLTSGLSLKSSIYYIIKNTKETKLLNKLHYLKRSLNHGHSFSNALSKSQSLEAFYCDLIHIGEQTGNLEYVLSEILNDLEKRIQLSNQIKKAITYPLFLISASLIMIFSILYYIFPNFVNLFNEFSTPLPLSTRIVIATTNFMSHYFFIMMLMFVTIISILKILKFNFLILFYEKLLLRLPIIGQLMLFKTITNFSRNLALCLKSGLPIKKGLQLIKSHIKHHRYQFACEKIETHLTQGNSFTQAIKDTDLFPTFFIQIMHLGENTAQLEWSLSKCAQHYEQIMEKTLDHLTNLIEPLLMIILGIMIGGMIIAMYQPLFDIGNLKLL